jgi:hypothetical protein
MSYIDVKEVNLLNEDGQVINPAEDESVVLLRRLLYMAQSLGARDGNGYLRMNISAADTGLTVNTVNAYGGVSSIQQITDWARTAYNTGIRSNIIIS